MPHILTMLHIHMRKRVHQKLSPYPHPNKFKRYLDKVIFIVAVASPLAAIPQAFKIWTTKQAGDISLLFWLLLLALQFVWLTYGLVHKEKPIILNAMLWIMAEIVIITGILMYS